MPPVLAQPFFPVGDDELAIASASVLFTNIEEVLWDLLSVIRPKTFSKMANLKEDFWKEKLVPLLEGLGFSCYGPFSVEHGGEKTNLDLLVVDHANQFALACELKWLKTHDQLRDCSSNDRELANGTKQVELCVDWLRSNPSPLSARIPTAIDWSKYSFEGIVLSRNSLGSSRVQHPGVPVLNRYLLETILLPPHRKSLQVLWSVAKAKTYLPKRGLHYEVKDLESSNGSFRLIGKEINMLPGTDWSPTRDISFN